MGKCTHTNTYIAMHTHMHTPACTLGDAYTYIYMNRDLLTRASFTRLSVSSRGCVHLYARECSKRRQRRLRVQRRVHGAQRWHVHGVRGGKVQGLARDRCMHRLSRQLRVACRFVRPLCVGLARALMMSANDVYAMPMLRRRICSNPIYDIAHVEADMQ
jgi:hypothetical protein